MAGCRDHRVLPLPGEAEEALAQVIDDEPGWAGIATVVEVNLDEFVFPLNYPSPSSYACPTCCTRLDRRIRVRNNGR
jgi:hypothetical protein